MTVGIDLSWGLGEIAKAAPSARLTVLYTGQRQVATDQRGFPQPN
jgi:hypothetical protein